MAKNGEGSTGATNHFGEIFKGDGDEVHEGLVCVDGAVIPTALGNFVKLMFLGDYWLTFQV